MSTDKLKKHLYAVGTNNNVGIWSDTGWKNLNLPWDILQITSAPNGMQWCVGTNNNAGVMDIYNTPAIIDEGHIGGWSIICLAFHPNGDMWCVGTNQNLGKMSNTGWVDQNSNWNLKFIAFDGHGVLWGVGANGNLGKWDGSEWVQKKQNWDLKSIMFDGDGDMWGVGTNSNVGNWNGQSWNNLNKMGGWDFQSLDYNEDMLMQDLHFDKTTATIRPIEGSGLQDSKTYNNSSKNIITATVGDEKKITNTALWSGTQSITLGLTESTEIDLSDPQLPYIKMEETIGFSASATSSMTTGVKVTSTQDVKFSTEIQVPAETSSTVTIVHDQGELSTPYTGSIKYKGMTHIVTGTYIATNVYHSALNSKDL